MKGRKYLIVPLILFLYLMFVQILNLRQLQFLSSHQEAYEEHIDRLNQDIADLRDRIRVDNEKNNSSPGVNFMTEQDKVQEKRIQRIHKVCDKYQDQDYLIYAGIKMKRSFVIDDQSRTIYCFNHKAASSTWLSVYTSLYKDKSVVREIMQNTLFYR
jgi:galactokinase/mevalonate kinase-like predicted kinase